MQCPVLELAKSGSGIKLAIQCPDPYLGLQTRDARMAEKRWMVIYMYIVKPVMSVAESLEAG